MKLTAVSAHTFLKDAIHILYNGKRLSSEYVDIERLDESEQTVLLARSRHDHAIALFPVLSR